VDRVQTRALAKGRLRQEASLRVISMAGRGRVTVILPLLRAFADYNLFSVKELKETLKNLGATVINAIGEAVYNYCCVQTISERALSEADKTYLRKFSKELNTIIDKKVSFRKRRKVLASSPRLVRKISEICVNEINQLNG